MEDIDEQSTSAVAEQQPQAQQSSPTRNPRRNKMEVAIFQYPRASPSRREMFGREKKVKTTRKRESMRSRYRESNLDGIFHGTIEPDNKKDFDYCEVFGLPKIAGISNLTDDGDGLDDIVTLQNSACYMCNGFYAQNHGEATCSICHAFLFPHFAQDSQLKSLNEDSDSDSGNDEPQDSQLLLNMYSTKYMRERRRSGSSAEAAKTTPLEIYEEEQNLACESASSSSSTPYILKASLENLPTEVLLIIIQYLDEMSLWSLSQANRRFSVVVSQLTPGEKWKQYTLGKWQFLSRNVSVRNWYYFYTKMMKSSFCFRCIKAMSDHEIFGDDDNPWRENRLRTESRSLQLDPLEGIWAIPLDRNKYHWQACIEGPAGSPYEGGKFYLYMQVPYTYPMTPPIVRFITKIFHPNVSRHGDIGIDSIQHNWSLALTVGKVLISIQSLLTDPYCEVCMEPEIGSLYSNDREAFEEQASMWTWKYAMNELKY